MCLTSWDVHMHISSSIASTCTFCWPSSPFQQAQLDNNYFSSVTAYLPVVSISLAQGCSTGFLPETHLIQWSKSIIYTSVSKKYVLEFIWLFWLNPTYHITNLSIDFTLVWSTYVWSNFLFIKGFKCPYYSCCWHLLKMSTTYAESVK